MFMPSGAAAAGGGSLAVNYRIRAARTLSGGGFVAPSPAGWTWSRIGTGLYTWTHDFNTSTTGVAFIDTARTANASCAASTQRSASPSWPVQMNRAIEGGFTNSEFWVYSIEPLAADVVQLAVINGTSATFIGPAPPGWTITKTTTGTYRLLVPDILDKSPNGGTALFCTPLTNQDGRCLTQSYFGTGSTSYYSIQSNRLFTDGALFDCNFYVALLRSTPELIQGVHTISSGGTTGTNPRGMINTRTGVGLYTLNPQIGEPPDPRTSQYAPWVVGLAGQNAGGLAAMSTSVNTALIDMHRAVEGAPQDRPYSYQVIYNPETGT